MSNEAFEKWLKENYLVDMSEFIVDEQERTYIKENNILRKAWQAAKADSESILSEQQNTIAELKKKVKVLERDYNFMKDLAIGTEQINTQLQAHINDLREALNDCYYEVNTNFAKIIKELISKTPAQSLQEHDNEVIERCAKICESSDRHRGEYFATKIRALKT